MGFNKTAKVPLIALAEGTYDLRSKSLIFTKSAGKQADSVYQGDQKPLDIQAMIGLVAKEYNISENPNDYMFEAARAVTAEVPNENGDAFPRNELLRFDHRLGKAVYQTFILKPHHINHRADNPKTSRGLVLDASYNDLTPALPECPGCGHKTASVEGRDSTGVGCGKCGHIVKDEFVELLIAIDTKKDPTFANGVRNGSLDSLSMGCEAGYTDCSICDSRARSVSQFCSHIKSGNKKKIFKTASGPKMSFEKCGEVVFTEISRVDQPADPTARQREVFQPVPAESEMLMLATRLARIEAKLSKGAQLTGEDPALLEKIEELKTSHPELYMELKQKLAPGDQDAEGVPDPMSIDDYQKKHEEAISPVMSSAEMGIKPDVGGIPATIASRVASKINSKLDAILSGTNKVSEENKVSVPTLKFAQSYKDLEVSVTEKGNVRVFTPKGTLFVIRPDPKPADAAAQSKVATEILTEIAESGIVHTASKYKAIMGPHVAQVLQHHMEDFAGGREDGDKGPITDKGEDKMNALPRSKPSKNLQEDADSDMAESLAKPKKNMLDGHEPDHKEKIDSPAKSILDGEINGMDEARAKPPKNTLQDSETDRADKKNKTGTKVAELPDFLKKKTEGKDDDKSDDKDEKKGKEAQMAPPAPTPTPPAAVGPDATGPGPVMAADDGMCKTCNKESCICKSASLDKKYVTRMERIYKNRIEKVSETAADKVAVAEKTATDKVAAKFLRSLKLAAKRQALNLEASPLKARLFDVLSTELDLDHESVYPGMDALTASRLVEATADAAFDEFVDSIVKRATEFIAMNDEAFAAVEADVKNLQTIPVSVSVQAPRMAARNDVRQAAMNGNLVVAPSSTKEVVSSGNKRDNIRSALDTTKVRRTSQALLNK